VTSSFIPGVISDGISGDACQAVHWIARGFTCHGHSGPRVQLNTLPSHRSRVRLKCDGFAQIPEVCRGNGRDRLSGRGPSVQSTIGSRDVRIGGSNAGYTMFRGSVKGTGYRQPRCAHQR